MAGYSRTPKNLNPIRPNTIIVMEHTVAKTGRRRLMEGRLIAY